MKFPSLLYTDVHSDSPIASHVFEDLQLTQIVDEGVFFAAGYLCGEEDISARQAVFAFLEAPNCFEWLESLYSCSSIIAYLSECMEDACCEEERNAVFPALFFEYLRFSELASEIPCTADGKYPVLISRFSSFFSGLYSEAVSAGYDREAERVSANVSRISECRIRIDGKYIKFYDGAAQGFSSRLKRCAEGLGVSFEPEYMQKARRQDKSFFESCVRLYPEDFSALSEFYNKTHEFYNADVTAYKSELRFYIGIHRLFVMTAKNGIPMCYPSVSGGRETHISDAYDISLLSKQKNIVPNDIDFTCGERFFFLTGANGGGKTTYLRTVGIAAVLFMLGCPVPCRDAKISVFDRIFTHFPHDERFSGSGRFVEEHQRAEHILELAGEKSLVLLNETYSSTNEENAIEMTMQLAEKLFKSGAAGLYITHMHGLSSCDIPYLNVIVDKDNDNRRTFKIARRRSDNTSLAYDILKKYRLTEDDLRIRFADNGD